MPVAKGTEMAKKDEAKPAEVASADGEEQESKFTKKKLIIIGAAVLVLLLAGGGAAFFFLMGEDPATEAEVAEQAAVEAEAAEQEPAEEAGVYYAMEPEFVVTLAEGSRFRALQTKIEVYSTNPDLLDKLKKHDPMLRHHLSNVFATKTSQELLKREGREQLKDEVKAEIENKLEKVGVRKAKIDDLFFTQFVME